MTRLRIQRFILTVVSVSLNLIAAGQFTSVGPAYGVNQVTTGPAVFGHALSIHDFNGDGLDDISFGTTNQTPQFYQNTGNGFMPVTFGIISPNNSIKSILWVDLDNDGDKDLFISHENSSVKLYENTGNMTLVDITFTCGLTVEFGIRQSGAGFGDYNNDGFLDLYLCKYYNSQFFNGPQYENKLYRNNGDMTFTDITVEANASVGINASFMPAWFDFNSDGWQDIFVVNDRIINPNHLLRNNGDGTFTDVAPELGMNVMIDAMGFSMGDFNNDLLQDIFIANSEIMGNYLYKKFPNNTFQNIATQAGVLGPNLCWSGLWMDYDNNGLLDLHVATELYNLNVTPFNYFFVNNGNETFTDAASAMGLSADNKSTWATAQGDWNMDGYPDFISHNREPNPSLLWQNNGGSNTYFALTLEGTLSNRDAIGSTIYCYAGGQGQMRYMACGENYLAQDSGRKIFGLGQTTTVDSLIIQWLSGTVDKLYNINANQTLHVVEGSSLGSAITLTGAQPACPGDTITLDAGPGLNYTWSTGATSQAITVTESGTYSVVIGKGGFDVLPEPVEVMFFNPPIISVSASDALCFGQASGTIELFNMGATGLTEVQWNVKGSGETLTDLPAGLFTYLYIDANGCTAGADVQINQPDSLVISSTVTDTFCYGVNSGSIELVNENNTGIVSVQWTPDASGPVISALAPGSYSYVWTDDNGCTASGTVQVSALDTLTVSIFMFLPPNPEEPPCLHTWTAGINIEGGTAPYSTLWQLVDIDSGETIDELQNVMEWLCFGGGIDTELIVTVTDVNGCETVISQEFGPIISVEEVDVMEAKVFPNPIGEGQTLTLTSKGDTFIKIFSLSGSLVLAHRFVENAKIDLASAGIAAGVYLLHLHSDRGHGVLRLVVTP